MSIPLGGLRARAAWPQLGLNVIALLALSACGGGGGGGDKQVATSPSSAANQPAAVETRTGEKIRLGGVVSKGLLGNANVTVWPIQAGAVDRTAALATGTTDAQGNYLTGEFTVPGPFIVEVTAKACEDTSTGVNADKTTCSYHQDEALGAKQYLPSAFNISAVVTAPPANVDNVSHVNVTLFSDFAIRAALKASGGLSTTNLAKAQAMVNNLFGTTDLNTVTPRSLPAAGSDVTLSPAEARLSAMLAAASTVAATSAALQAIGCTEVSAGTPQATLCTAEKLAGNASTQNYVGTDAQVTAQLDQALQTVVQASGSAELVAVTSTTSEKLTHANLLVPEPADSSAGAYATVKNFFKDLVDFARQLLAKEDGEHVIVEARQFQAAVRGVSMGGNTMLRTASTFQIGAQLYTAYRQSGGTTEVYKFYHDGMGDLGNMAPAGRACWLVDGSGNDIVKGASPSTVAAVLCYTDQSYAIDWSTPGVGTGTPGELKYKVVNGFHNFQLVPVINGSGVVTDFTYTAVSFLDPDREVVVNWSSGYAFDLHPDTYSSSTYAAQSTDESLPLDPFDNARTYSGTINGLTYQATTGSLLALTITGDLPDDFPSERSDAPRHADASHGRSTNLARNRLEGATLALVNPIYDAAGKLTSSEATFSGRTRGYLADGSTIEVTIDFSNGHMHLANNTLDAASFEALAYTSTSSFKGLVDVARLVNNGLDIRQVQGSLYNNGTASGTPFVDATMSFKEDQSHKTPGPHTPTNFVMRSATFDGYLHAPGQPKVRLTLTAAVKQSYDASPVFGLDRADAASGDYFMYASDGSLKRDVTFTLKAPDTPVAGEARVISEFVDPTHKVAFGFGYNGHNRNGNTAKADTWAKVLVNKVERGTLDTDTGSLPMVTLSNGESFSLDTGTIQY